MCQTLENLRLDDSHWKVKEVTEWISLLESLLPARQSSCTVRQILINAKKKQNLSPVSLATTFLVGLQGRIFSLSCLILSLFWVHYLWAIPKTAFHISGNHQMVSHLVVSQNLSLFYLFLPRWHGALAAQCLSWILYILSLTFCDLLLLLDVNLRQSSILVLQSHGEITGTKGRTFCHLVTLSTPILWHIG